MSVPHRQAEQSSRADTNDNNELPNTPQNDLEAALQQEGLTPATVRAAKITPLTQRELSTWAERRGQRLGGALEDGRSAPKKQTGGADGQSRRRIKEEGEALRSARRTTSDEALRSAYKIPYWQLDGSPLESYWRIRFVPYLKTKSGKGQKYSQPKDSSPHLYIPPPSLVPSDVWYDATEPIIITEGEKKALAAAQHGFNCIAVGGVDSWHSKTLELTTDDVERLPDKGDGKLRLKLGKPKETETEPAKKGRPKGSKNKKGTKQEANAPAGLGALEGVVDELAEIEWAKRKVLLIFDTDRSRKTREHVLNSLFELACWLEGKDAEVVYVPLPLGKNDVKIGLDDYLLRVTADEAEEYFNDNNHKFPPKPDLRAWIYQILHGDRIGQGVQWKAARATVAELDKGGRRLRSPHGTLHYYDEENHALLDVPFNSGDMRNLHLTEFGGMLQEKAGIGGASASILSKMVDLFTSRPPIRPAEPVYNTYASSTEDAFYLQVNNQFVIKCTPEGIELTENGDDDVYFRPTEHPMDPDLLLSNIQSIDHPSNMWLKLLNSLNITPLPNLTPMQTKQLVSAVFYMSPWLKGWRRLMLPLEICIGEPTSGKTTLYNLRKFVYSGDATLDHQPSDVRDWYTNLGSTHGMWICDNLGEVKRELRDRISDELARLITEPAPSAKVRQLYTTSMEVTIPIRCTFAVTSIWNPFYRPDILERSIVFRLNAISPGEIDSDRIYNVMGKPGTREEWVAQHVVAIQLFLQYANDRTLWSDQYRSGNRLTNFEQALRCMLYSLGVDEPDILDIIKSLPTITQEQVAEHDPTMEAMRAFALDWFMKEGERLARWEDILNWLRFDPEERYSGLRTLQSTRGISLYCNSYKNDLRLIAGLEMVRRHNTAYLRCIPDVVEHHMRTLGMDAAIDSVPRRPHKPAKGKMVNGRYVNPKVEDLPWRKVAPKGGYVID